MNVEFFELLGFANFVAFLDYILSSDGNSHNLGSLVAYMQILCL